MHTSNFACSEYDDIPTFVPMGTLAHFWPMLCICFQGYGCTHCCWLRTLLHGLHSPLGIGGGSVSFFLVALVTSRHIP